MIDDRARRKIESLEKRLSQLEATLEWVVDALPDTGLPEAHKKGL